MFVENAYYIMPLFFIASAAFLEASISDEIGLRL
jgi:hypothetical protein